MVINGKEIVFETPPFLSNERIFVPVRFVAEKMGARVDWDAAGHTVTIEDNRGDLYLKGRKQSNGSSNGIMSNLIKASELKNMLDDDGDNNLADYRNGYNGGDSITNDPLVVDIRKQADYDAAHIPGAVWLAPAENMAGATNIQKLQQLLEEHTGQGGKSEIILYCYTGNTSGLVTGVLGAMGLPVKNMMYGFDIGWRGTKTADQAIYGQMESAEGNVLECGG